MKSSPPFVLFVRIAAALFASLIAHDARADSGFGLTLSVGGFLEFGDEAGTESGLDLWIGTAYFPSIDLDSRDAVPFIASGVQLRTGFLPLLTGPNQASPQLRVGYAFPGGADYYRNETRFDKLTNTRAKVFAIVGYRAAGAFGLDNDDGLRQNEHAVRIGIGAVAPAIPNALDAPMLDGLDLLVDVNFDGSIDRYGMDVVIGF